MDEKSLKNLNKLLGALDTNAMSSDEIIKAFELILVVVKQNKDTTEKELQTLRGLLENALVGIDSTKNQAVGEIRDKVFNTLETELSKFENATTKKLDAMQAQVDSLEDGESPKPEDIVPLVMEQIKLPEYKETVLDSGEQIIDKINDDESEKKIKREKVEGLDEEFKKVEERIASIPRGNSGARSNNSTKFYKLTPDGSTKVFSVPKSVASIVLMSDFPHILFEGSANGFTINGGRTQITLTTDNAPSVGSQLLYQYSSMFN